MILDKNHNESKVDKDSGSLICVWRMRTNIRYCGIIQRA